jgi:uncharacterized membrane protein
MTRAFGKPLLLVFSFLLPAVFATPAAADLRVCNQTSYILYVAGGNQSGATISTHGWTRIVSGDCGAVFPDPLATSPYFIYARSSEAHSGPSRAWGGSVNLCAKDANFALQTPVAVRACQADDAYLLPFAVVATHGRKSWTETLTESPLLNSLGAARQVGIARLLNDIGYNIAKSTDAEKAQADALTDFRARSKLPITATNSDLFAALETAAFKASAPAGYSVCNDSDGDIWAAIGLQSAGVWISRGWWKINPGACAKTLTDALATDKIYLLAANKTNDHFVTAKFCITNIQFDTTGRDKCATKGLSEAGFAVTDTKGRTGYAAHIGRGGLLPPAQQQGQARKSK